MTQDGDFSAGHVGGPFSCTEISLKDVPEMGYRHTDTWHGADPRDAGGGGQACDGRGEVGERVRPRRAPCVEGGRGEVREIGRVFCVVPCCGVTGMDGCLSLGGMCSRPVVWLC